MPTPDEYAAARLAARAEKYRQEVARLRALAGAQPADEDDPEVPA
ncbi:hypothetical protein J2X46_002716 [Nocardioides sp. BE266]|nr:hypothetical protein [Nocardioides sp. BE266]MDR7253726.1 hypothetical protein [Nocardioides sp. BE266]